MHWTTDPPTEAGRYERELFGGTRMVDVDAEGFVYHPGDPKPHAQVKYLRGFGRWRGPIAEPEEG